VSPVVLLPSEVITPLAALDLITEPVREGYQTILDLWAQVCPTLPQPRKHDAASKLGKTLRAKWAKEPSADLWRERFDRLASNEWNLTTWRPDLGSVLAKTENIDNGRHDRKHETATQRPFGAAPAVQTKRGDPGYRNDADNKVWRPGEMESLCALQGWDLEEFRAENCGGANA